MKHIDKIYNRVTPVLPAIYGESLSYAEELGKIKQGFNDMVDNQDEMVERLEQAEQTVDGFDGRMSTAEGDIDNLEQRADGVDSQIGDIQEQIGNNTLGVSVPKYNADFQDHEYELSGTLASLEDGMVGLVQKACPVPNDNDPSETDPAVIYRAKVNGWDEVKSDISGLQEKLGNNTVKTSVPRYNVQFTDHEYEIVDEHDDIYEGLEDGQVALLQKECATPNDSDPTEKFPELVTTTKVKGWEKVITDERVWGLTEVEGNPITLEVVQENEAKGAIVKFEPKQNLNGYEYPWAGGANVNKAGYHTGGYVDATGAKVQNSQYGMTDVITLTDNLYLNRGTAEHFGYAIFSDAECTTMTSRGEAGTEADSIAYNLPSGTTAYALCWWDLGSGVTASQSAMDTAQCEATIGTQATEWTSWANVCPIEGWTQLKVKGAGKNLCTVDTVTHTVVPSSSIVVFQGNLTGTFTISIDVSGVTSYTDISKSIARFEFNGDKHYINAQSPKATFTGNLTSIDIPNNSSYCGFLGTIKIQLEVNDNATPFESHREGVDISVPLGQTVYGGELDVVKGECKVTYGLVDLGSLTWTISSSETYGTYFSAGFSHSIKYRGIFYETLYPFKAPIYRTVRRYSTLFVNGTITLDGNVGLQAVSQIQIKDERFNDATDFKNSLNGVYASYELATPTVITSLTPAQISLLEGVNTLWTDGKSLDVLYVSDIATIKQLNDKLAETIGDIAGTEYATATSNHSVNDFIIFNGGFYKVISAITAGDTLVVGTNIRKTTIGAELTAILNG